MSYLDSEKHFRRYEQYIAEIVNAWPNASIFLPNDKVKSTETLSSRIRICIKAMRQNMFTPTSFSTAKFIQICDEIYVSTSVRPGAVVCGPMDMVLKARAGYSPHLPVTSGKVETSFSLAVGPIDPQQLTTHKPITVITENEELIRALLVLHHHQVLLEPSTINTAIDVISIAQGLDVAVQKDSGESGSTTPGSPAVYTIM